MFRGEQLFFPVSEGEFPIIVPVDLPGSADSAGLADPMDSMYFGSMGWTESIDSEDHRMIPDYRRESSRRMREGTAVRLGMHTQRTRITIENLALYSTGRERGYRSFFCPILQAMRGM